MKKILSLLISAIALLLIFSGCAEKDMTVPDGFVAAESDGTDYRLCYPAEWILERCDAGGTSVYVSESDFSNVSVSAFMWSNDYSSLKDYVENYYFKQFADNFSNLEYKTNEDGTVNYKKETVDGKDALVFDYSAKFSGENFKFRTCVLLSDNGYLYTLTYTAKEALFDSHSEAVDVMIKNFKFKH